MCDYFYFKCLSTKVVLAILHWNKYLFCKSMTDCFVILYINVWTSPSDFFLFLFTYFGWLCLLLITASFHQIYLNVLSSYVLTSNVKLFLLFMTASFDKIYLSVLTCYVSQCGLLMFDCLAILYLTAYTSHVWQFQQLIFNCSVHLCLQVFFFFFLILTIDSTCLF